MATKLIAASQTKLTAAEKVNMAGDALFIAACKKSTDAADLEQIIARVRNNYAVLRQEGDGAGRRFSGAKSHNFADQLAAAVDTFTRGKMLKAE